MFSKALSANLDKASARQLSYIVIFTLYCILRSRLLPPNLNLPMESVHWMVVVLDVITFAVIIGIAANTIRRKNLERADWGIRLRSKEWFVIGFIGAAGVYFAITTEWLNITYAGAGLLIVVQFMTYELVFRALLMNILLKTWGNSLRYVLLTVFISALVYSAVLLPMDLSPGMTLGVLLVLNYLFYLTRSIILFTFLMAGYAVPNEWGVWVALFSILIYLGITLVAKRWEKEYNKIDFRAATYHPTDIDL